MNFFICHYQLYEALVLLVVVLLGTESYSMRGCFWDHLETQAMLFLLTLSLLLSSLSDLLVRFRVLRGSGPVGIQISSICGRAGSESGINIFALRVIRRCGPSYLTFQAFFVFSGSQIYIQMRLKTICKAYTRSARIGH